SPKPSKGTPLLSKRSRKTNGFRSCPKSDGLISRVMGPWLSPRVRAAISRWELRVIVAERVIGASSRFRTNAAWLTVSARCCGSGRGGGRQQVANGLAGALDAAGGGFRAHLQAFGVDESDVIEAEETQHRPEVWLLEVHSLGRTVAVDAAATGDDEDLLALEQPLGPGGAIAEGPAAPADVIEPGLQRR